MGNCHLNVSWHASLYIYLVKCLKYFLKLIGNTRLWRWVVSWNFFSSAEGRGLIFAAVYFDSASLFFHGNHARTEATTKIDIWANETSTVFVIAKVTAWHTHLRAAGYLMCPYCCCIFNLVIYWSKLTVNNLNCVKIIFSVGCHYHVLWQLYVIFMVSKHHCKEDHEISHHYTAKHAACRVCGVSSRCWTCSCNHRNVAPN